MKVGAFARRFLAPRLLITVIYYFKFGCFVSAKAEVELSPLLTIGKRTKISAFCKIKATRGPVRIGADVSIATSCFITGAPGGLEIGDSSHVGPSSTILSGNFGVASFDVPFDRQPRTSKGTRIGRNVLIGANCVILDGSTIGDGVIVSPGSVVSGRIESNTVVQGNPAKVIFRRRA
ncbi:MAG TPA: acyltransferase [Gammaproteobacteria bacterium]